MTKYDIKYIIKKILIYSGVALILMFVNSCKASALVLSANVNSYYQQWSNGQTSFERNWTKSDAPFKNISEGTIMFTFTVEGDITVREVYLDTWDSANNAGLLCSIGTTTYYNDSNTQVKLYTALCDVPAISQGIALIHLGGYAWNNGYIDMSSKMIYTNFQNQNDYNQSINDLVTNTGYMLTGMANIRNDIQHNEQAITAILNSLLNANNNGNTALQTAITNAQNQAHQDSQNTQQKIDNINNTINNDNVDNQQSSDFFNNFGSTTNEGLQDLIKKPIAIINSFYNSCSPIVFDIPYFDTTITLPCISSIQNDFTSVIFPIIKVIVNGLLCYRILLAFIDSINKLKDPNNSDLEVVDL